MKIFFNIIIAAVFAANAFPQNDSKISEKEIQAGDYRVSLTNSEDHYFTGSIQIADKFNNTVFYEDSIYTGYNSDTLIDLDGDGNKELILDLTAGATMYYYNMFIIFDFTKSPLVPFQIQNAVLMTGDEEPAKIVSNVRVAPGYLGAEYAYSLIYKNGSVQLETDADESKVLRSLIPTDEDEIGLLTSFTNETDECADAENYIKYFETYLMQTKISGDEDRGWKFFDKHYNCADKKMARRRLKDSVDEYYSELKKQDYIFRKLN